MMGQETISVVYSKISGAPAYHGTLVYTNAAGEQFFASAAYSNYFSMTDTAKRSIGNLLQGELSAITGGLIPSPYGSIVTFSGPMQPSLNFHGQ
jgi:hypothetical protein